MKLLGSVKNRRNRFGLLGLLIEQMCSQHLFSTAGDVTDNRTSLLPENMEQLTFITIYPNRFQCSFERGSGARTGRPWRGMILWFTWVTFFFPFFLSSFLSVWAQNAYYAQIFFLIALISCAAGDYSILRESRKFQPVCLHLGLQVLYLFLIWLHHFLIAARLGFCQHHALGTCLPVIILILLPFGALA